MSTRTMRAWGVIAILILLLGIASGAGARSMGEGTPPPVQGGGGPESVLQSSATVSSLLQYQARLTNPSTGQSVADGSYSVVFSLYGAATGGSPLWTETKSVVVANGLFNTALGDATALSPALFNGQALWLGVKVGSDAEATPRQQILPTAYALSLRPGAVISDSIWNTAVLQVTNGDASTGGGSAITAINYSNYVWRPAIYGESRGAGAGVYGRADGSYAVWGWNQSNSFAGVAGQNVGSGNGVTGDSTAGYGGYFTGGKGAIYAGGMVTATGDLFAPRVRYATPHTQYFVVGGEAFVPGSNVAYVNTYGMGGAYIASGSGALVAPVHLPQGAVLTGFKVFFNDTSANNMSVSLNRLSLTAGAYSFLTSVSSTGITGYGNGTSTSISSPVVDNTLYGYHVYAWADAWDSNLRIMGALITYTIDQAP